MKIASRSSPRCSPSVAAINWLSAARFFLFGSRDVWFVVGLPVYLYAVLGWTFTQVGGFLALWVIGYGIVQAAAPRLIRRSHHGRRPRWQHRAALGGCPVCRAGGDRPGPGRGLGRTQVVVIGLIVFGVVFAINSAVHSYLILAYSDFDKVSMNVGFYYMANAGGRLTGTVLSGWAYQAYGLEGCLWWSAAFVALAAALSIRLPAPAGAPGKAASP